MNTKQIAGLGVLTAIVIVLQAIGGAITIGGVFSITLVLVPIIVGAALYGCWAGAWLGFVFGGVVLINNSSLFYAVSIPGTILTVLAKGILCGLIAGLVYKLLAKVNSWLAAFASAIICPIVNTGVFLIGCSLFFMDTMNEWGAAAGFSNGVSYMFLGLVGVNFLVEMGVNIILSVGIIKIIDIVKKNMI